MAAPGGNAEGAEEVMALKGHSGSVFLMVVLAYSTKEGWCGHSLFKLRFVCLVGGHTSFYREQSTGMQYSVLF